MDPNVDPLMLPPSRVRLAAADELKIVRAMALVAFAESKDTPLPSPALDESIEDVQRAVASGGALLAESQGLPLGSVRFAPDEATGILRFERLAVLPAVRGRGIGTEFLAWLETHAKQLGLREVRTVARTVYPDQRSFFIARGYVTVGPEGHGVVEVRKRV